MGIVGLTSYVRSIGTLWTKIELKDTDVVIDGSCLLYYLYINSGLEYRCGGEYDEFAEVITAFFNALTCNGVKPFVLMDGAMDSSERKLTTHVTRAKKDIQAGYTLSKSTDASVFLLPMMARSTAVQVIQSLGIPFAVCDCEADEEIASLAHQWSCPVISNDSDFFIFEIQQGYIPLASLDWQTHPPTAELFRREKLAAHLKLLPNLLPLLASLLGNDFISMESLGHFNLELKRIQPTKKCSKRTLRLFRIVKLLSESKELEDAVKSVLKLVTGAKNKANLNEAIKVSLGGYAIPELSLSDFFEQKIVRSSLRTLNSGEIPPWVLQRFRDGHFPGKYIGCLSTGKRFLRFQVENVAEKSANCCSLQIRLVLYDMIMKLPMTENKERKNEESINSLAVKEWDRDGSGLKKCILQPLCGITLEYGEIQSLESIPDLQVTERQKLVLTVLKSDTSAIARLPDHFQLYAASIRFWISHADPGITETYLKALILTSIQLHKAIDQLEGSSSRSGTTGNKQCKGRRLSDIPFSIEVQHSYAQWQAIMQEAIYLNQVLLEPLESPVISRLYSGVMARQIVAQIEEGKEPETLVWEVDMYRNLHDATTEGLRDKLKQITGSRPEAAGSHGKLEDSSNEWQEYSRNQRRKQKGDRTREIKQQPAILGENRFGLLCELASQSSEETIVSVN